MTVVAKTIGIGVVVVGDLEYAVGDGSFELSDKDYRRLRDEGMVGPAQGRDDGSLGMVSEEEDRSVEELNLDSKIIEKLIEGGYEYVSQIESAEDSDLTDLPGIGSVALRKIRSAI